MNDDAGTYAEAVASVSQGTAAEVAAGTIVARMTPEEKLWCLDGDLPFWAGLGDLGHGGYHKRPFPAAEVERLGVPGFAFSDGPRGVVVGPATCFPVSMARGATWDLHLEERIGDAIGRELRAVGASLFGGVCVNLLRHPAWGRAQETYGEDPYHVGEFGAALVRGVQRHAMACVKHFACNSMENSRFTVDVTVDEVALHEVFLPQFRRIVDEGVAVVMSAYNSVNGAWCGQSRSLLTDILRDEWGFPGFAISDWIFGIRDAPGSVIAGLDVEMPYRMVRARDLPAALKDGSLTWDDVDRCVVRVMTTLLRFDHLRSGPQPDVGVLACAEHRDLAREAAAKSVVLLRNEPVADAPLLPLRTASLRRVAVIGRLADIRNTGDGGSSDVWAPAVVTPLQGLRAALPGVEVDFEGGDAARAAELAGASDLAIVVVGYTRADEGEFIGGNDTPRPLRDLLPGPDDPGLAASFTDSVRFDPGTEPPEDVSTDGPLSFAAGGDRASLRLHEADEQLIVAVADANPRTIVAVVAGSAVIMSDWSSRVPAIVQSWYAGMEGGHGLADVLIGRRNADGRLPFTVAQSDGQLPHFERETESITYDQWHGWWKFERDALTPHFPFGYGLSYTSFDWGEFSATVRADTIELRGTVANVGDRGGAEVVQVYGTAASDQTGARARRLVAFARVEADPGEAVDVVVSVPLTRLSTRNPLTHSWDRPSGTITLQAGRWVGDPDAQSMTVTVGGGQTDDGGPSTLASGESS